MAVGQGVRQLNNQLQLIFVRLGQVGQKVGVGDQPFLDGQGSAGNINREGVAAESFHDRLGGPLLNLGCGRASGGEQLIGLLCSEYVQVDGDPIELAGKLRSPRGGRTPPRGGP